MGKATNKEKGFSDIISEINEAADSIIQHPEGGLLEEALKIKENTSRIYKYVRGVNTMILIMSALLIILFITVFVLMNTNDEVRNLNEQLIESNKMDYQDSLKNTILLNSKGDIDYDIDGKGKPVTYNQLSAKARKLSTENYELKDSLDNVNFLFNYAKETYGIKFKVSKKDKNTSYTISSVVVDDLNNELREIKNSVDDFNRKTRAMSDTLKINKKKK